jgi:hypothetical protein
MIVLSLCDCHVLTVVCVACRRTERREKLVPFMKAARVPLEGWNGKGTILEACKTSWYTNFDQFCQFDQLVASILPSLKRLWPNKTASFWREVFSGAQPAVGLCERQAVIVAGVRKVHLRIAYHANATIVRFRLNSWLPRGARRNELLPHKLSAAPTVQACRRGFAELVDSYCRSNGIALPVAVTAAMSAATTPGHAATADLFGQLFELNAPQLRGLRGRYMSSFRTNGVQLFILHYDGATAPSGGKPPAASRSRPAKPGAATDRISADGALRKQQQDDAHQKKSQAYQSGTAGQYSLATHVPIADTAPTLHYADVNTSDGSMGQLLVGVTTVENGRTVHHIAGDPGLLKTYVTTPPAGATTFGELQRAAFGDAKALPQRSGRSLPLLSRHQIRRNHVPPAVKAAEAALAKLSLTRVRTPTEALDLFVSAEPSRAISQGFWGSVGQRSRRLVAAARRRACLHAFVKHLIGTADRKTVVFHAGTGFSRRNAGGGRRAANVTSTVAFTARHMRSTGVNEYNTSKKCPVCHCGLMLYDHQRMGTCTNAECGVKLDRDVVGACNILRVVAQHLTDGTRPVDLCPPRMAAAAAVRVNDDELEGADTDSDGARDGALL